MSIRRLLITPRDIVGLKEFDMNTRPERINPHILSAQREDIMPLIKERLYNAIIKDPVQYKDLLDEGYYTYEGQEYVNYGLKSVIALFANARFTMFGDSNPTPHGHVYKQMHESEMIDKKTKDSLYLESQKEALDYWGNVRNYLVRTKEPLFNDMCVSNDAQTSGGMSFTMITRNH